MKMILFSVLLFSVCGFADVTTAWFHDPAGPRFQFDRFRGGCFDEKAVKGFNQNYVGECGDLRGVDLTGQNLSGKNFRGADMRGAKLQKVDLSNSDLRAATLLYSNWENTGFKSARVNADTVLPFDAKEALKLNILYVEYAQLDKSLITAFEAWLKTPNMTLDPSVRSLIEAGANYLQNSGYLIHEAIKKNRFELLDFLLQKRGFNINGTYDYFTTYYSAAVSYRSSYKDIEFAVNYLITNGADTNLAGRDGTTAVWVASSFKLYSIVDLLIKAGAKLDVVAKKTSLLLQVLNDGDFKMFQQLVDNGANINFCISNGGACSLLEAAAKNKNQKVVDFLLAKGVDASKSFERPSILDYFQDVSYLTRCLALGANVKMATIPNRLDLAGTEFLLQNGANVNAQDSAGNTLLMNALLAAREDLVELALRQNADIRIRNKEKMDAFGFIFVNETMTAKYLSRFLAMGVDPNLAVLKPAKWKGGNAKTLKPLEIALQNRAYFMPLARAGAKFNESIPDPRDGKPVPAFAAFVMGFPEPLSAADEKDLTDLAALGADLNSYRETRQGYAVLRMEYQPRELRYSIHSSTEKNTSVSLAAAAFQASKLSLVASLNKLGAKTAGPQNGFGQTLAHMATSAKNFQFLITNQIPIDGLDNLGRNALYSLHEDAWELALAQGLSVQGKDKNGDSVLAYMVQGVCDRKLVSRLDAVLQKGAEANLVSDQYGLSLAHLIAAEVYTAENADCAIEIFNGLKPWKLNLNSRWNFDNQHTYGLLGIGLSNFNFKYYYTVEQIESDDHIRIRQSYFNLVRAWISLGYDPLLEATNVRNMDQPLIEFAYERKMPELIKYLKSLGVPERPMQSKTSSAPPASNACNFFVENSNYGVAGAGCLSKQTGITWSAGVEVNGVGNLRDHEKYCESLGKGWVVPNFKDLFREEFTGLGPNGFAIYSYRQDYYKHLTVLGFNPRIGDIKTFSDQDKGFYVCRFEFIN